MYSNSQTAETELRRRTAPRAMSIAQFCQLYSIGRTRCYQEIGAGRLPVHGCGKRRLIALEDAERWLRSLPVVAGGAEA